MANFFKNQNGGAPMPQRVRLAARVGTARLNLLLVAAFTAINILLALFGSGTYFLFSASVPYFIALTGAVLCGRFPAEYYTEAGISAGDLLPSGMIVGFALFALGITALYLLAFALSKKKSVFLTVALVFFAIDTVAMFFLYSFAVDMLIDLAFHAWVIVELVLGVRAAHQLKTLPQEQDEGIQMGSDGIPFVSPIAPDEEKAAEAVPAEEAPAEEASAEDASAEETPAEESPAEEAPAEDASAGFPENGN